MAISEIGSLSGNSVIDEFGKDLPRKTLPGKQLEKNDFMKLFLKQLSVQSPLKPMDNSAMMQNMAQMTSLTATEDLDKTIKSLQSSLGKNQVFEASQVIGKKVVVPSELNYLDGSVMNGSILLEGPADQVNITIKDKNGSIVKTIKNGGSNTSGVVDYTWDGKSEAGEQMKPDFYTISVNASINGKEVGAYAAGDFKVNSVAYSQKDNSAVLNLDGLGGVDMSSIIKIL